MVFFRDLGLEGCRGSGSMGSGLRGLYVYMDLGLKGTHGNVKFGGGFRLWLRAVAVADAV